MTFLLSRRNRVFIGGMSLVAATVLFAAVFTYLAVRFDYPDVLDRSAGEVFPALLALGGPGRLVWALYGVIPLLLVPTARGVHALMAAKRPRLARVATWLALGSAIAMMLGLLRWPTLNWVMAQQWLTASPDVRGVLATRFDTANLLLGNVIGEFVGELLLNGFFLIASVGLAATHKRRTWVLVAGALASGLGWTAMLRNLTPAVASAATLNNTVLPLWMLTLGVMLILNAKPATEC